MSVNKFNLKWYYLHSEGVNIILTCLLLSCFRLNTISNMHSSKIITLCNTTLKLLVIIYDGK